MISPNVSLGINIGLAVLGVIAGSSSYFTDMFGNHVSAQIVETAAFSVAVFSSVNVVLHAYSSPKAGMMVSRN